MFLQTSAFECSQLLTLLAIFIW